MPGWVLRVGGRMRPSKFCTLLAACMAVAMLISAPAKADPPRVSITGPRETVRCPEEKLPKKTLPLCCWINAEISAAGKATEVEVACTDPSWVEPVRRCHADQAYRPATADGKPIPSTYDRSIEHLGSIFGPFCKRPVPRIG